jgi:hypothetical protein
LEYRFLDLLCLCSGRDALPHTKSETTEGIEQKELHDDGLEEKQLNGGDTDEGLKKGMTVKRDDAKKDDSKKHTHRELVAILAYLELKKRLRSGLCCQQTDRQGGREADRQTKNR